MAKINNLDDFHNFTSNITSFSHAYLLETNSLVKMFFYAKELAKIIICGNNYDLNNSETMDICYKIDHDEFDDLYVVNPDTIGINTVEITNLLTYMQTKSLRENGKRVYIIYGFERLSNDISNKILKFLEEPSENIYAILLTENIDRILPTIISRCQVLSFSFDVDNDNTDIINNMKRFLTFIINNGNKTIGYINNYFSDALVNRALFYEYFNCLEKIISLNVNAKYLKECDEIYKLNNIDFVSNSILLNILEITVNLKKLILQNINLNLLLDRYIIEVTKELITCKK